MPERIFIEATTTVNRYEMTARVEQAISESGSWVLDHHLFSNLSMSLTFEISDRKLNTLVERLEATGLAISHQSADALATFESSLERAQSQPGSFVEAHLQIIFIHSEPDLRREVPAIPG